MCVQLAPSGGSQVQQSGRGRSIKTWAFVHPQHCPVVWSVPPSLLTCHAHIYPPILGTATPMHYLGYDFLFLWLEQPSPPTCRTLCLRKVGVGCGKAAGSATPPHTLSLQQNPPKLSIYYVCPKAWLQRYNYKKKLLFLSINMRQAQELIGHE